MSVPFAWRLPYVATTPLPRERHDIITDGFDFAIRAGWPRDGDLLTRKIGHADRHLVASPDYVAARPAPIHPHDLKDLDWIRFIMRADKADLFPVMAQLH